MMPQLAFMINQSLSYMRNDNFKSAELLLKKVIKIAPNNPEALRLLGIIRAKGGDYVQSLTYLTAASKHDPKNAFIFSNIGNVYLSLRQFENALLHYKKSLILNPTYAEAQSNMGNALYELKRFEESISAHKQAILLEPRYAEAYSNMGNALYELKRFEEALGAYEMAMSIKPTLEYLLGSYIHTKLIIGNWDDLQRTTNLLIRAIEVGAKVCHPHYLLSIVDDASMHLKVARNWLQHLNLQNLNSDNFDKKKNKKIRLAYFSTDFGSHPVALLTSELFKLHDRGSFDVFAFSLKNFGNNDPIRKKLLKNFDQFFDLENKSDFEISKFARSMNIDIAIDLNGHTNGARMGIFAQRAAPIQVSYLGYAGTSGASFIDYILADKVVIPANENQLYSEKIVRLPHCFMVDDSERQPSKKQFTRADFLLPEAGTVFCSFNNSFKFNPSFLNIASKVLLATPKSVLWVSENNETFKANLKKEFFELGVDPNRIVFAKRLEKLEDHLARYSLADIFLDSSPYGAHTTALDSLKSGVPVLTLMGKTYAGRVVSSLLNTLQLRELITHTPDEYIYLASHLANNPKILLDLKSRLKYSIQNSPLFNTPLNTKAIEKAYSIMYQRYMNDESMAEINL